MQKFIILLLEASITMSLIGLIYMASTPLLSKRITAKGRYYAWLIIILGLIIPFRFHFQVSAIYIDSFILIFSGMNGQSMIKTTSHLSVYSTPFGWPAIMSGIWMLGVICFIVFHLNRHRKFMKMINRWSKEVIEPEKLRVLIAHKKGLQINKRVDLRVCPGVSSPMLIGFLTPTILLPVKDIPDDELSFILKHELVHYKRRDMWYKSLVFVATAFHWFNPFVYRIAKEVSIQCELACDEEVVRDANILSRQKYVEAIIGVIRKQSKTKSPFSTNFYSGKYGIKQRVFSIMDSKAKRGGTLILIIIFFTTISTSMMLKTKSPEALQKHTSFDIEVNYDEENDVFSSKNEKDTSNVDTLTDYDEFEQPLLIEVQTEYE